MNFVTSSDFTLVPYSIPNINKVVNTFEDYANEQIEKMLEEKLLGFTLTAAFKTGLAQVTIEEKWTKLRDGAEYTYGGKTYKWKGMRDLFRPFIYAMWLRDNYDNFSGIGVTVANAENSQVIDPSQRIVRAWNDFAHKAGVPRRGSFWNYSDFGYPYLITYYDRFFGYNGCANSENTLYGFVEANKVDYPDWQYCDVGLMNTLGI